MGEYISFPDIVDSFREVDERVADIVIGPAPAWQTVTFENSWSGGSVRYLRDGLGFVHLRGRMVGGVSTSQAFILPAGFRPAVNDLYAVAGYAGGTAAVAFLNILPTGPVRVYFPTAGTEVGLGGVSFLAER